jgi:hypothetical protein
MPAIERRERRKRNDRREDGSISKGPLPLDAQDIHFKTNVNGSDRAIERGSSIYLD